MNDKIKKNPDDEVVANATGDAVLRKSHDKTVFRDINPSGDKGNTTNATADKNNQGRRNMTGDQARREPVHGGKDTTNFRKPSQDGETRVKLPAARIQEKTRVRQVGANKSNQPNSPAGTAESGKISLKGRFTLEKVIGVGGMGVVYKAIDKLKVEARDREPFVAIKVLNEEFKAHPESFIALQRESRKTQRIAHPNVVKVYDFDRDRDTVFMTMEYMEGLPLDQLIRQYSATGLPREEAWNILKGLCSALIYAHAENIVHSDFKPGNIFITDSGVPKIFDFGIARAVAKVDRQTGKIKDRTVFDAGSLGALTPAYASLEMLMGSEPDTRDDVYALGCIAYEILTGGHPFNRLPADEAFKAKLKPKKISGIKKRQWRAIEKALMFKRVDRLASVEEFYSLIQPKVRSVSYILPVSISVILIVTGAVIVYIKQNDRTQENTPIQVDKLKFKIQYDIYKNKLLELINNPAFSSSWEDSVWEQVTSMLALLKNKPDAWLLKTKSRIYRLYIERYKNTLVKKDYMQAGGLLKHAYRYADNTTYLDAETTRLDNLIRQQIEQARAQKEQNQRIQLANERRQVAKKKNDYAFSLALKNVNQQLECRNNLNMREFTVAIEKLRSIDAGRFAKLEGSMISTLVLCISNVAKFQPERAAEDKKYALRVFPGDKKLSSIVILPRDPCDRSIAGLGARGERAVCRDGIPGFGVGPALVVVPGNGRIRTFAIGKYETSVKQINTFCRETGRCQKLSAADDMYPAVNIGISLVRQYLNWLTAKTQHKYRLPTRKEWIYAAEANGKYRDPNRNCALNSRGIEKGGELVRANTGSQNGWGLVNYLGNAREWVYDKSHNLVAVGGSYQDAMDKCTVLTETPQAGSPDDITGFRVLREVTR